MSLSEQLSKVDNPSPIVHPDFSSSSIASTRNLDTEVDSKLSSYDRMLFIGKSCHFHVRDIRHIRPIVDQTSTRDVATALF